MEESKEMGERHKEEREADKKRDERNKVGDATTSLVKTDKPNGHTKFLNGS